MVQGKSIYEQRNAAVLAWAQGGYFLLFGLWPIADIHSFQRITGEKTDHLITGRESDHWLVFTVGATVAAVGAVLLNAAWRQRLSAELALLGLLTAVVLGAIDVIFVAKETIAPIYLADAAIEAALAAGWAYVLVRDYKTQN